MLHNGDTHVTNDRSLLHSASKCDEYLYSDIGGMKIKAEAIGDVYLELANNLTFRLQRVRYAPTCKYNLLSDFILQEETGFAVEFGKLQTYLCIKERSCGQMRFEAMNMVAGNFVFLSKDPAIEYVKQYAAAHPTPNRLRLYEHLQCRSYTQHSRIGQIAKMREQFDVINSSKFGSHKVESLKISHASDHLFACDFWTCYILHTELPVQKVPI